MKITRKLTPLRNSSRATIKCPECGNSSQLINEFLMASSVISRDYCCSNPACYLVFSLQTSFLYYQALPLNDVADQKHSIFVEQQSKKRKSFSLVCPACGNQARIVKTQSINNQIDNQYCECVSVDCKARFSLLRRVSAIRNLSKKQLYPITLSLLAHSDAQARKQVKCHIDDNLVCSLNQVIGGY